MWSEDQQFRPLSRCPCPCACIAQEWSAQVAACVSRIHSEPSSAAQLTVSARASLLHSLYFDLGGQLPDPCLYLTMRPMAHSLGSCRCAPHAGLCARRLPCWLACATHARLDSGQAARTPHCLPRCAPLASLLDACSMLRSLRSASTALQCPETGHGHTAPSPGACEDLCKRAHVQCVHGAPAALHASPALPLTVCPPALLCRPCSPEALAQLAEVVAAVRKAPAARAWPAALIVAASEALAAGELTGEALGRVVASLPAFADLHQKLGVVPQVPLPVASAPTPVLEEAPPAPKAIPTPGELRSDVADASRLPASPSLQAAAPAPGTLSGPEAPLPPTAAPLLEAPPAHKTSPREEAPPAPKAPAALAAPPTLEASPSPGASPAPEAPPAPATSPTQAMAAAAQPRSPSPSQQLAAGLPKAQAPTPALQDPHPFHSAAVEASAAAATAPGARALQASPPPSRYLKVRTIGHATSSSTTTIINTAVSTVFIMIFTIITQTNFPRCL